MEYISAKEFLKQPVEVQEVFIGWWKPSEGDLVSKNVYIHNVLFNKVGCIDYEWWMDIQESDDININDPEEVKQFVLDYIGDFPLLTEGQLRKFIEDKYDCKVMIEYTVCENIVIKLGKINKVTGSFGFDRKFTCHKNKFDLLRAYWVVACEIAKED